MLPKLVILLTCLYVAEAGVLTADAYADDNYEVESAHENFGTLDRSVRNCVNSQCNNICRALGFARGVCISPTVCRCSGIRMAQDALPEAKTSKEAASFDDVFQDMNVYDDAYTLDRSVRSCTNLQCNNLCRALGFARGVCVSPTVCRCSGIRMAQDALPEVKTSEEAASFDDVFQDMNVYDDAYTLDRSVRSCTNLQCNNLCRALGFARGVCVSPTVCRCSGIRMAQDALPEVKTSEEAASFDDVFQDMNVYDDAYTLDRSVRSCTNLQCNNLCRALGFARGVCVSPTVCRCSGIRMAQDALPEVKTSEEAASFDDVFQDMNVYDDAYTLDRSVRSCTNPLCNNLCRALGFARGVCISPTVCRCSGIRMAQDALPEAKTSKEAASFDDVFQDMNVYDDAYTLDRSVRSCTNLQCNNLCRALGFARGVCVSPTVCRCSGIRMAQDALPEVKTSEEAASFDDVFQDMNVYDDAYTLDRSVRSCTNLQCNNLCRALGFARGVCVSPTVCRCSGIRMAQDALPEVKTSEEAASFDDVFQDMNVYDDAYTLDRSVRSCTNLQCNNLCRALGFARGVCVSPTVCRCSGIRMAQDALPEVKTSEEAASFDDVFQDMNVYDDAYTLDRSVRSCTNPLCNNLCRALGFARGVCISPTVCRCSGIRMAQDALPEAKTSKEAASFDDVFQDMNVYDDAYTLDRSVRSCTNPLCNNLCRALGFARGVCISPTVCRCSGIRMAQEDSFTAFEAQG